MSGMQGIVDRLNGLIKDGKETEASIAHHDYPHMVDSSLYTGWNVQALVFLTNILGESHLYTREWQAQLAFGHRSEVRTRIELLKRVRDDIEGGWLRSIAEIVHAEVFDDYLEMAAYLVNYGYKDAAAVLAGSTCEAHLRRLSNKHSIPASRPSQHDKAEPKKASVLNGDLRLQKVYNQPQWRQIQAWLDIRNNAAHGDYSQYSESEVRSMINGIRAFLIANPA